MSNTIKSDKIALEQLLNSISPATPGERGDGVTGAVDSSGGAPVEPEQIIIFDRAGEQKAARKRARNTVKLMAQHALPKPLLTLPKTAEQFLSTHLQALLSTRLHTLRRLRCMIYPRTDSVGTP